VARAGARDHAFGERAGCACPVYDLAPAERAHPFHLAGVALPVAGGDYRIEVPEELRAVALELDPYPAYLIGPRTDVLVWNAAATRLLGEPSRAPDGEPNLLWWLFTDAERNAATAPVTRICASRSSCQPTLPRERRCSTAAGAAASPAVAVKVSSSQS
jgi:PAS domain-containing protein